MIAFTIVILIVAIIILAIVLNCMKEISLLWLTVEYNDTYRQLAIDHVNRRVDNLHKEVYDDDRSNRHFNY